MPRLALVGPGAIGCTMLAWLSRNPAHHLVVGARTAFAALEVETPEGRLTAAPEVLTDPARATPADWVLVATKTYDTDGAAAWLRGFVGPHTRVAVLQNGVEHRTRFAALVPEERLVPVVVDCPAERTAPGRVRQRGPARQTVPDTAAGCAYAELFAGTAVRTETTADWTSAAWRKLCINAAGAVSAITLQPAGISHDEGVAELMRGLVREVIAVGRAEGAVLDDALAEQVVAGYRASARDSLNSLHADRLAGRRMETDARNGVLVRLGRRHGIATPLNEMAVALLGAVVPPSRP